MPNISFRNVKKVYPNGTYALDGINFDILQGDFICLIGESGGGKTTLLKLIAGLEKATSGEIYFDGELSNFVKVAHRDVAFVFQEYTIYPNMTVFENIVMSLHSHKIPYEAKCEIAWEIIKKMDLELIQGEMPKALSFGQCQKVALAKVLVRKPKIVLFDEPLSNIDVLAKNDYKKLIIEAKKVLPYATFIYVTHSISDAMQLANKIMVIHNGQILQYDDKYQVYEYPKSSIVADYMLEECHKYYGAIRNNTFTSNDLKITLNDLQVATLDCKNFENVLCYSFGKLNIFFDKNGNALTGFNKIIKKDSLIVGEKLIVFGREYDLSKLKYAKLHSGNAQIVFNVEDFSLDKIADGLMISGKIAYVSNDLICVKIDDFRIPFAVSNNFCVGEEIDIYYPIEKLQAIDETGNLMFSSYVVSENTLKVKVINAKKGIALIGGKKVKHPMFIGQAKQIIVKVPLDAFYFSDKGEYVCNDLFNEELLGNKKLIHFLSKKLSNYLSAITDNSFAGYKMNKIRFDVEINKLIIID